MKEKKALRTWLLIVGIVWFIGGWVIVGVSADNDNDTFLAIGTAFWLLSIIPYMYWYYLWVKLKNRDGALTFLGLLSWIGFLILLFLEDKSKKQPIE